MGTTTVKVYNARVRALVSTFEAVVDDVEASPGDALVAATVLLLAALKLQPERWGRLWPAVASYIRRHVSDPPAYRQRDELLAAAAVDRPVDGDGEFLVECRVTRTGGAGGAGDGRVGVDLRS